MSKAFESNVDAFVWGADAKVIYFTGVWHGESQIYALDLANDSVKAITSGMYDYEGVALFGDKLIAKRHSMSMQINGTHRNPPCTFLTPHPIIPTLSGFSANQKVLESNTSYLSLR